MKRTCQNCIYRSTDSERWHEYRCDVDGKEVELRDEACRYWEARREEDDDG